MAAVLIMGAFLSLSGCSGRSADPDPSEVKSSMGYNGSFDEETFEKICSSIKIGGESVELPCSVGDIEEKLTMNDNYAIFSGGTSYSDMVGHIKVVNNSSIDPTYQQVYGIFMNNFSIKDTSIGGLTSSLSKEDIESFFGKPTGQGSIETDGDDMGRLAEIRYIYYEPGSYSFTVAFKKKSGMLYSVTAEIEDTSGGDDPFLFDGTAADDTAQDDVPVLGEE